MWDDEIDEVARRLTATPPPHDLAARVLARIDRRAGASRRPRLVWAAVPVAAIAAVAIAAWLGGGPRSSLQPARSMTSARTGNVALPARATTPPHPTPEHNVAPSARRREALRAATRTGESSEHAVRPLVVDRLAAERVQLTAMPLPTALVPESLAVSSLTLTPLSVEERRR